jgi:hypothetical protein
MIKKLIWKIKKKILDFMVRKSCGCVIYQGLPYHDTHIMTGVELHHVDPKRYPYCLVCDKSFEELRKKYL